MKYDRIIFLIFVLVLFSAWFVNASQERMTEFYYAQIINSIERREAVSPKKEKIKLDLESEAAICKKIDKLGNEENIFEKEVDKGLPVASLTKLMTAIITIENYSLNDQVVISKEAADQQNAYWGGNLVANQTKTIEELLEISLIFSSNDATYSLSEHIGRENFIAKMNQKVDELGLENTHFINSSGLDPITDTIPNYSTAEDLAKIAKYILENHPVLFEISLRSIDHKLNNSLSSLDLNKNQKIIGGKTGYTFKAGGCLLTVIENRKNEKFINIVLGTKSYQKRVEEMQKIINIIN